MDSFDSFCQLIYLTNQIADTNCYVVSGTLDREDAEMRKAR